MHKLAVKFKISRGRAQCHVSLRDSKFHVERTVKLIRRSRSRSLHDLKFALAPRHALPWVKLCDRRAQILRAAASRYEFSRCIGRCD